MAKPPGTAVKLSTELDRLAPATAGWVYRSVKLSTELDRLAPATAGWVYRSVSSHSISL